MIIDYKANPVLAALPSVIELAGTIRNELTVLGNPIFGGALNPTMRNNTALALQEILFATTGARGGALSRTQTRKLNGVAGGYNYTIKAPGVVDKANGMRERRNTRYGCIGLGYGMVVISYPNRVTSPGLALYVPSKERYTSPLISNEMVMGHLRSNIGYVAEVRSKLAGDEWGIDPIIFLGQRERLIASIARAETISHIPDNYREEYIKVMCYLTEVAGNGPFNATVVNEAASARWMHGWLVNVVTGAINKDYAMGQAIRVYKALISYGNHEMISW